MKEITMKDFRELMTPEQRDLVADLLNARENARIARGTVYDLQNQLQSAKYRLEGLDKDVAKLEAQVASLILDAIPKAVSLNESVSTGDRDG